MIKLATLTFAASLMFSQASEYRTWTSLSGASIEAQLVSYKDSKVKLNTKAAKQMDLDVSKLSLADRQYLIEFAEANADLLLKQTPSVPEKSFRKKKNFIKKIDANFGFSTSSSDFTFYETDHYVLGVGKGVKPHKIAETAEACWHGMAFQHYEFIENWGKSKRLILIPTSDSVYKSLGKYEVDALTKAGHAEHAQKVAATWDRVGAPGITVPSEKLGETELKPRGIVFRYRKEQKKNFSKTFGPFPTHVLCSDLYSAQAGGVSNISNPGYFTLSTGHAYYKEIQLAKKTETHLLSSDYNDDVTSKSGFKDGTAWAKTLKKMVKKEEVKLNVVNTLGIKSANDLTPKKLVTMYSLSCYMQSSQKNIASYAKLTRLINTSRQVPPASEIAKIFGFSSVKEFQDDWTTFVKSKNFK